MMRKTVKHSASFVPGLTKIAVVLLAIVFLASLFATAACAQTQGVPAGAKQTAGERFKNVQVLKDIPADQLLPSMDFIASSLGVRCNHCHVRPFEKDEKKEKATARQMITMMMNLNKGSFEGKRDVTCYTCHRGAPKPVGLPVIPEPGAETVARATQPAPAVGAAGAPAAKQAEALPTAEQLVEKYTRAIGGAEALGKLKTRVAKGLFESEDFRGETEEIFEAPSRSLTVIHTPNGNFTQGFDGTTAWQQDPAGRVGDRNPAQARQAGDFLRMFDLKKAYGKMTVEKKAEISRQAAYVVNAEPADGQATERLYFAADSGLLLRLIRFTDSPLGTNVEQTDFSDYRDTGGVKVPFAVRHAEPRESNTTRYQTIQYNAPVDSAKFAKPASTAPAPPARP
jgi:photosynthetic reaction center cytochrome c subunit